MMANEEISVQDRAIAGIIDALFGLALGLGAFSLTSFPLRELVDVVDAILFFGVTYIFIVVAWIILSQFYEELPLTGTKVARLDMLIIFLVILAPFLMRTLWTPSLQSIGSIFFSMEMSVIFMALGVMYQVYVGRHCHRSEGTRCAKLRVERNVQFILSLLLLFLGVLSTLSHLEYDVPLLSAFVHSFSVLTGWKKLLLWPLSLGIGGLYYAVAIYRVRKRGPQGV
jgi:uncharacterized membrane protein